MDRKIKHAVGLEKPSDAVIVSNCKRVMSSNTQTMMPTSHRLRHDSVIVEDSLFKRAYHKHTVLQYLQNCDIDGAKKYLQMVIKNKLAKLETRSEEKRKSYALTQLNLLIEEPGKLSRASILSIINLANTTFTDQFKTTLFRSAFDVGDTEDIFSAAQLIARVVEAAHHHQPHIYQPTQSNLSNDFNNSM